MKLASATIAIVSPIRRVLWTGVIDVVETVSEARRGLSAAVRLDEHAGMLFGITHGSGMTMAETRIPLDIIFMDGRGVVLGIETGMPLRREPYIAPAQTAMALEIRGGLAAKKGIMPGAVASFRQQR